MIMSPKEITIEKSLRLGLLATNNESEYEALLTGVVMVKKLAGKVVKVFSDSRLVVRQVEGELRPGTIGCRDILVKPGNYNLVLNLSPYSRFRGVRILMQTLWQLWRPLLSKAFLGSSSLRIYCGLLSWK